MLPTHNKDQIDQQLPNTINVGIFGHVDTGKSTLLGHLFYKLKIIDEKQMRQHEKISKQSGKGTFKYAWVLD